MHLDFAERMRQHAALCVGDKLDAHWSAFYLGNIAADYQAIADIPREVTHFYALPMPQDEAVGWERLLLEQPTLASADNHPPSEAIFLAGYAVHLLFDVVWYKQVLIPHFWLNKRWDGVERRERFLAHNILLAFFDQMALQTLPKSAESTLAAADPKIELPFIEIPDLTRWQNFIVAQLKPNAMTETVAIYAERLGIESAEFAAHLNDPAWMRAHVFDRVPRAPIEQIFDDTIDACVALLNAYLA
jgi:hypothetical protein